MYTSFSKNSQMVTCSENGQNLKKDTRVRQCLNITPHLCLPYKALAFVLRWKPLDKLPFSQCNTSWITPAVLTSQKLFSSKYPKPFWALILPQVPKGFPGNAIQTTYCNCGQQSVDLSPSCGWPQRQQCCGSFGWPVIASCSLSFHLQSFPRLVFF